MRRYFDVARRMISHHGGTVEKFIGDAAIATGCAVPQAAPRCGGLPGPASPKTCSSRYAATGWLFPFSRSGSNGSALTAARTNRHVCGPITISPGAAACSSRAAMLTASPVANRSAVPVTT